MLKTVTKSSNKKLGGCATTYRSGNNDVYGTCPNTCSLKPPSGAGSDSLDYQYMLSVFNACPENGVSWTYTHFTDPDSLEALPIWTGGKTVINLSADTIDEAINLHLEGFPATVVVPASMDAKVDNIPVEFDDKVSLVRCPAEYREEITCSNCGGTGIPLCARNDRSYIIKFTAHGNQAKKVGTTESGGCYGTGGPVQIQWKNTMKAEQEISDAEKLTEWVKTLKPGTYVRHHVVGDLG